VSGEQRAVGNTRSTRKTNTAQRIFTGMHTFFYRLSGGKLGGRLGKSPVLLLTTRGRKTGEQRTTPLLYLNDHDQVILVASNGGAPIHPAWWLNLQANAQAEVEIGRRKLHMMARQADGEERQRLWPLLVAMYPAYAQYQKKTARQIPIVILYPQQTNIDDTGS
jgi:F420H(2)-dependent quinone reductase